VALKIALGCLLMMTLSRGAFVALVAVGMSQICFSFSFRSAFFLLILVSVLIFILHFVSQNLFDQSMVDLFSGFLNVGSKSDQSANMRFQSYYGAFQQFSDSPFFGDISEERSTGFYPHNIFLELLMATGLFGFVVFLIVNSLVIYMYLCHKSDDFLVVFLLYIQYFVASLFSGSVFTNSAFWVLLFFLCFGSIVEYPRKLSGWRGRGDFGHNN
jgi:O-antigen ligase